MPKERGKWASYLQKYRKLCALQNYKSNAEEVASARNHMVKDVYWQKRQR
jgi:hypothetical protein